MTDYRITFRPEPQTAAIAPSERGWLEFAPEPRHPHQIRCWMHGDGSPGSPRSLLLTFADIRRLQAVLGTVLPEVTP